jgi:hypothetical protein
MTKICAIFFVLALGLNAMADGTLSFNMQNNYGFQKLSLNEMNGVRSGSFVVGSGAINVVSYVKNNQLAMQVGNKTNVLNIQNLGGGSTLYKGFLDISKATDIQVYDRGLRGYKIVGTIKDLKFEAESDAMTKQFYLKWGKNQLFIWGAINPKMQTGACKGAMVIDDGGSGEEVGKFNCQSSGSMKDTLFKNPQDLIATIIHLFVVPE